MYVDPGLLWTHANLDPGPIWTQPRRGLEPEHSGTQGCEDQDPGTWSRGLGPGDPGDRDPGTQTRGGPDQVDLGTRARGSGPRPGDALLVHPRID